MADEFGGADCGEANQGEDGHGAAQKREHEVGDRGGSLSLTMSAAESAAPLIQESDAVALRGHSDMTSTHKGRGVGREIP